MRVLEKEPCIGGNNKETTRERGNDVVLATVMGTVMGAVMGAVDRSMKLSMNMQEMGANWADTHLTVQG